MLHPPMESNTKVNRPRMEVLFHSACEVVYIFFREWIVNGVVFARLISDL